jgi:hypothetical protein
VTAPAAHLSAMFDGVDVLLSGGGSEVVLKAKGLPHSVPVVRLDAAAARRLSMTLDVMSRIAARGVQEAAPEEPSNVVPIDVARQRRLARNGGRR